MIKEYSKGLHSDDPELAEHYLDWFFLQNFGKGQGFWKSLDEEKLIAIITLAQEKEKKYWENWKSMFKQIFGK